MLQRGDDLFFQDLVKQCIFTNYHFRILTWETTSFVLSYWVFRLRAPFGQPKRRHTDPKLCWNERYLWTHNFIFTKRSLLQYICGRLFLCCFYIGLWWVHFYCVTPVSSRKLHMLWIFFWLYSLVPAGHCPEIAQIEQLICSAIKERSSAFLKLLVDTRHYLHDLFCHTLSMFGHLQSEVWFHLCGGIILHIVHQCSSYFYIIGTGVPTGQLAD